MVGVGGPILTGSVIASPLFPVGKGCAVDVGMCVRRLRGIGRAILLTHFSPYRSVSAPSNFTDSFPPSKPDSSCRDDRSCAIFIPLALGVVVFVISAL